MFILNPWRTETQTFNLWAINGKVLGTSLVFIPRSGLDSASKVKSQKKTKKRQKMTKKRQDMKKKRRHEVQTREMPFFP